MNVKWILHSNELGRSGERFDLDLSKVNWPRSRLNTLPLQPQNCRSPISEVYMLR